MKYLALTACLFTLAFSSLVSADESYSGVWEVNNAGDVSYVSIHVKSGHMIAADLDPEDGDWAAFEGSVTGNAASVNSIYAATGSTFSYDVTFDSASQATIVLTACNPAPGDTCVGPVGTTFTAAKIF